MRKILFGVCIVIAFAFASCATSSLTHVFDPGIPVDQMSFLWIPNYIRVTQFNNKAVDWIAPALSLNPIKVGVPSGENTFIIETIVPANNTTRIPNVRNKSLTINFESGKGYQLINRNGEIVIVDQSGKSVDIIQPTAVVVPTEVIDIDLNSLFAEISNNPVRARQLYHGQTIRVTGKILTIDQLGVGIGNNPIQMLVVFLAAGERPKLVNLNSGQEITVKGVLDISDMRLDQGVIE